MAFVHVTPSSSLRGSISYDKDSRRPVYTFLGIPFAEPPVGDRRFQPPVPAAEWTGERDATEYGPMCPQNIVKTRRRSFPFRLRAEMSEDCLYLNVWSPNINRDARLPVMVWIHGGAWIRGSADLYPGLGITSHHDVVYVSLNYRVGPFGFLSTGDGVCRGNLGLLDQVEALRWVRAHIDRFGGDPENVTIFGESAGGISVHLHLLSDLCRGLFRRAISQSGVSLYAPGVWPLANAGKYLKLQLKNKYGYQANSSKEIIDFLRTKSVEELAFELSVPFLPVIDGVFLKDDPANIYSRNLYNHVDYLLGSNSHEGVRFVMDDIENNWILTFEDARKYVKRYIVNVSYRHNKNVDVMTDVVLAAYGLNSFMDREQLTAGLCEIYGDWLYIVPTADVANRHSVLSRTYLYHFNHRPSFSMWPSYCLADHTDEIQYVIGAPFLKDAPANYREEDEKLSLVLMEYWTNFAKTGNPNGTGLPMWKEYSKSFPNYMILNSQPEMSMNIKPQKVKLWTETLPNMSKEKGMPKSKY